MTADLYPQLIISGPTRTERLQLRDHTCWTLGRHSSNQIHLSEHSISRHHAKFEFVGGQHVFLADLKSRNGTTVNQQPVSDAVLLKHGDRIHVGQTELIFEHSLFLPPERITDATHKADVVMMHHSSLQGTIWQEVLLSQALSVRWEAPTADLKHVIERDATTQQAPRMLIIDIRAYGGDLENFCHWCRHRHPNLAILLMDSHQRQIPPDSRQQVTTLGCIDLLPAFREPKLMDNVAGIVVHLNLVLRAFPTHMLRQDKLFLALKTLETLIQTGLQLPVATVSTPAPPKPKYPEPLPTEELQDLTTITRRSK